jgi:DNA-directed RNA polymerase subunit omega
MIEALKNDDIVKKVGGRFKLAVLMQKRMVDVAFGAPLLVNPEGKTVAECVVQEILEDKISLDLSGGVVEAETETGEQSPAPSEDE